MGQATQQQGRGEQAHLWRQYTRGCSSCQSSSAVKYARKDAGTSLASSVLARLHCRQGEQGEPRKASAGAHRRFDQASTREMQPGWLHLSCHDHCLQGNSASLGGHVATEGWLPVAARCGGRPRAAAAAVAAVRQARRRRRRGIGALELRLAQGVWTLHSPPTRAWVRVWAHPPCV